jgi:cytochrome c
VKVVDSFARLVPFVPLVAAALALVAMPAQADMQLAFDKGCFNSHGDPPKKKAPTFAQLAADYAKHRDDAAAQARLCERLRTGSIFGHIDAHERLSAEDAARLVRWIADGAARE